MLSFLAPGSAATIGFLLVCFVLVLAFEFSTGFHDTATAVATVIYTNSLKPLYAVIWSGLINFFGVMLDAIAVAYALVELISARCPFPSERQHGLKQKCSIKFCMTGDLERQVAAFVEHYNHDRHHQSLDNLTPADVYFGRAETVPLERERIKRQIIANRRLQHHLHAA